ncbi:MAG: thiolase family protein [Rhodobacteraceae bacterium]|nr:thiolase family protein [Paracoccaceae bacterium]
MSLNDKSAIVIAARRTPIGRLGGALSRLRVEQLAAPVLRAVIADAGVNERDVVDVILGNAAGPGGNPARVAALEAGFPIEIPGVTIDRQCGSGLEAINLAARLIEAGAGDVYVAGGVESASTAPLRHDVTATAQPVPYTRARFAPDSIGDPDMGAAAENVARACHVSRSRQDSYALRSHQKAVAAQRAGRFKREIVPLGAVDVDECPRADTSLDALSRLKPAFEDNGTVTAGNACPVNDGAAAVVIVSYAKFKSMAVANGLWIRDSVTAGVDPNLLGLGPVPATEKLLRRNDLDVADLDLIEFNEAFAAQVIACMDRLGLLEDQMNVSGGALALGHPYGASGAILMTRLFTEMIERDQGRRGLATLGIGGGMGVSTLVERIED